MSNRMPPEAPALPAHQAPGAADDAAASLATGACNLMPHARTAEAAHHLAFITQTAIAHLLRTGAVTPGQFLEATRRVAREVAATEWANEA